MGALFELLHFKFHLEIDSNKVKWGGGVKIRNLNLKVNRIRKMEHRERRYLNFGDVF